MKFYLHNTRCLSELIEIIQERLPDASEEVQEKLAKELRSKFYEVEFDVNVNPDGSIASIQAKFED